MTRDRPRETDRGATESLRTLAQACWNLRFLGLFLVGPIAGVILAGDIFGLTAALYWTAGAIFAFTLTMYAILVRAEWNRLSTRDAS